MYDVTFNEILERMFSRVSNSFDKREGSIIYDALAPAALELQRVYIELNSILSDAYGDTASREYLILRCKERGVIPEQASKAILRGKFTPPGINVIGKRFNVNELNYVVTRALTDSDGGYEVQCETPGAIGNRTLGTMIPIEYIQGLETAELTEVIIPGEDDETTENLRKRYFDSFKESAFGGNVKDYINKVNAISGVSATKVKRVWNNDINPLELIPTQKVVDWANGVGMKSDPEVSRWLTAAINAGKEKKKVLIFSLEMPAQQLYQRLLSIESGIPQHKLKNVYLEEDEWTKLTVATLNLSKTSIFVADLPYTNVLEIRSYARKMKSQNQLDLIIIDYLQLINGTGRGGSEFNRQQEISDISRALKGLARELDVPVIALSQLSRAVESRVDKRPMLSDLRESGAIEQDADIVAFLYREEYYIPDTENKGITELIIGKHRNGATGTVKLNFLSEFTKFTNYTDQVK